MWGLTIIQHSLCIPHKDRNLRAARINLGTDMETETARSNMVNQQLRPWTVLNQDILELFGEIPRDRFTPAAFKKLAFADIEIPLAHHQCMMKPRVEGRLLQALNIARHDRVLEIGTGSGFLTACLAKLSHHVTSIDLYPDFIDSAREHLKSLGINNCDLSVQDIYELSVEQPYDVIAVTGGIPEYDSRFQEWLTPGGRLFVIVGQAPIMEATLVVRSGDREWVTKSLFETMLPPLINAPLQEEFML